MPNLICIPIPQLTYVISKSDSAALYSGAAELFSCKQSGGGVEQDREGSEFPLLAERPHGGACVDYRKVQTLSYIFRVCLDIVNMVTINHTHNCALMVQFSLISQFILANDITRTVRYHGSF